MPLLDCKNPFIGCDFCFYARNVGVSDRWVVIIISIGGCVDKDSQILGVLVKQLRIIDSVYEVVNLIVKVVVELGPITQLRGSTSQTIRAMQSAGNINECEAEGEDGDNSIINACAGFEIWVCYHSLL